MRVHDLMQAGGLARLLSVVGALILCAGPTPTTALDEYVATDLDDPLQPVWDRLDDLPRLVSEAVQHGVQPQFVALNRKIDAKSRNSALAADFLNSLHENSNNRGSNQLVALHDIMEAVTKIEGHIDTHVSALETNLKQYVDEKISRVAGGGGGGNTEVVDGSSLSETLRANTQTLENINTHVVKITEEIGSSSEGGDSCRTLVDKVSELMNTAGGGGGGAACSGLDQQVMTAVQQMSQSSSFLPRDCSDKHWQQPEAPSGVYETFPKLDHKDPISTYCDMGQGGDKGTGGWTVILRRQNSTWGLVDFNRTWSEYRNGFGKPGEGEWWYGLGHLHALTYRQPYEVDLLLHDIEKGTYHASYNSFRVEDETQNFKLNLNGFLGNLTHDALISKHHGSAFSTWDRDNDVWGGGSCAQRNGGGWWFNACHYTTLTAPFPTSNDRDASTIRWLEDEWLVLDDVTMKIRPVNYAGRFSANNVG